MTDLAAGPTEIPWHLSEPPGDDVEELGGPDQSDPPDSSPHQGELPPLWHRIATGAFLRWRLRALVNRARWTRRHAARRALRWIQMHPDLRDQLRRGRLRSSVLAYRDRLRRPTATQRRYRPPVETELVLPSELVDLLDVTSRTGMVDLQSARVTASNSSLRVNDLATLGPFDTNTWNPIGFARSASSSPLKLRDLLAVEPEASRSAVLRQARRSRVVRCGLDDHVDPVVVADSVVKLALSGAVLSGLLGPEARLLVGDELASIIENVVPDQCADMRYRERTSLLLRRQAMNEFGPVGRVRRLASLAQVDGPARRSVSVLLPSNRPGDLPFALAQVAGQRGVDVELVVGLHGSTMRSGFVDETVAAFEGTVNPIHLPDEMNLGDVMNELTSAASAPLVSKWDDDDWYDPWHLVDLVNALEYSGAGLVAKAAEFVFLEQIDLTMRRFRSGGESFSTTVAGGTLLAQRSDVVDIGWDSVPRQVDRRLIERFAAAGLETYRTHGLGYVLRRRGGLLSAHTWQVGDSYFLRQAVEQRPGLDLEFAGVEA